MSRHFHQHQFLCFHSNYWHIHIREVHLGLKPQLSKIPTQPWKQNGVFLFSSLFLSPRGWILVDIFRTKRSKKSCYSELYLNICLLNRRTNWKICKKVINVFIEHLIWEWIWFPIYLGTAFYIMHFLIKINKKIFKITVEKRQMESGQIV